VAFDGGGGLSHTWGKQEKPMFDFDAFADLTGSFNTAVTSLSGLAAAGVTAATVFSLADGKKNDGVEQPMKAVAKMSLMGMLF
jgi:hypothetical protein